MSKPGPKPLLNKDMFAKIKQSILDGNDLRQTAKVCEINEGTLYVWHSDNYLNISDKVANWKHERMLRLAEKNLEGIMCLGISDKDTIKTVQDTSKFVAETLGKASYAKRNEHGGIDGKDLPTPLLTNICPKEKDTMEKESTEEE